MPPYGQKNQQILEFMLAAAARGFHQPAEGGTMAAGRAKRLSPGGLVPLVD
jgi:hypothetical protein